MRNNVRITEKLDAALCDVCFPRHVVNVNADARTHEKAVQTQRKPSMIFSNKRL